MSDKLRSVNTKFWDDPFIEELSPSEKLLFLYLLTNSLTNLLGVYEISIKRISYDTGLTKETISKGFERFSKSKKAFLTNDNYVILPNWLKNQHLNTNMKVAVSKEFDQLPNSLKNKILSNGSEGLGKDSECFRMVVEGLGKYEIEIESEIEDEEEDGKFDFASSLIALGVEKDIVSDWIKVRRNKNASNTKTAFKRIEKEIAKSGASANDCIKMAVEKSWKGFEAEWYNDKHSKKINDYEFTEADFK